MNAKDWFEWFDWIGLNEKTNKSSQTTTSETIENVKKNISQIVSVFGEKLINKTNEEIEKKFETVLGDETKPSTHIAYYMSGSILFVIILVIIFILVYHFRIKRNFDNKSSLEQKSDPEVRSNQTRLLEKHSNSIEQDRSNDGDDEKESDAKQFNKRKRQNEYDQTNSSELKQL